MVLQNLFTKLDILTSYFWDLFSATSFANSEYFLQFLLMGLEMLDYLYRKAKMDSVASLDDSR